jgi:para-aminobenzoate synthetase/4-amino-4-deoxychorismate lyase
LLLDRRSGAAELGVGSGITAGSSLIAEYRECLGKAAFLRHRLPEFDLLESLLLEAPRGYPLLRGHLERLMASADYFGFSVDVGKVERSLDGLRSSVLPGRFKVRLMVNRSGEIQLAHEPIPEALPPAKVALSAEPVDSSDIFLFHKTTHRERYERALEGTAALNDVILYNERGELTESTRANLVLDIDGAMVTPPVECGLLGGVLRGKLLSKGTIRERVLKVDDLSRARRIFLVNSVRGWRPAVL